MTVPPRDNKRGALRNGHKLRLDRAGHCRAGCQRVGLKPNRDAARRAGRQMKSESSDAAFKSSTLARRYASIARCAVACCGGPDKQPVRRRPLARARRHRAIGAAARHCCE